MPQIIFKGITEEKIKNIANEMVESLSVISKTPADYFILERVNHSFIPHAAMSCMYPIVEVKWFDRGESCKVSFAKTITQLVQNQGYSEVEVFFTPLKPENYFENGTILG